MKRLLTSLVCVVAAAGAAPVAAQITMTPNAPAPAVESTTATPATGEVEVGARFGDVSGDEARFLKYRDLRDGVTLDRLADLRRRWRHVRASGGRAYNPGWNLVF